MKSWKLEGKGQSQRLLLVRRSVEKGSMVKWPWVKLPYTREHPNPTAKTGSLKWAVN